MPPFLVVAALLHGVLPGEQEDEGADHHEGAEEGNEAGPSKFKCVGCGHSPLNQISRKESVVELSCPTCHAEVFQCCHCGFSKSTANAKDICVSARSGRSLFVLVKKHIS